MALERALSYVTSINQSLLSLIKSMARSEKVSKAYRDLVSDLQSTIALIKKFLGLAYCIEKNLPNKHRLCHRWFLTEHGTVVSLVKLEPRITLLYDGSRLRVTYNARELEIEGNIVRFRVNNYRGEVNIRDESDALDKRSLLKEVNGVVKSIITHVIPDMELCIKEHRLRC